MHTRTLLAFTALVIIIGARPALPAGGDDVKVLPDAYSATGDLAVASDGTLFALVRWANAGGSPGFNVRRSTDGGTTWSDWATIDQGPGAFAPKPQILIAEGDQDRVFVAYAFAADTALPSQLHVAWSPLNLAAGDFSHDTIVASSTTDWISEFSLATDAFANSNYFVYAVYATTLNYTGRDIYFARAVLCGENWDTPYKIDEVNEDDRTDAKPAVACGYGGWVHVAWILDFPTGSSFDSAVRYRRVANRAYGAWGNMVELTPSVDGVDHGAVRIAAAPASETVKIACERQSHSTSLPAGIWSAHSVNLGGNWAWGPILDAGAVRVGDLVYQEAYQRWVLGVCWGTYWGYHTAAASTPLTWSALSIFGSGAGAPSLVNDATRDDRIALLSCCTAADGLACVFDAEWRADAGYPNLEDGFPVDLAATPSSDPAVADIDGDGDLEIVFTDHAANICIYKANGTALDGWPVAVGASLSPAPAAIGDMDGDGDPEILVGTADGRVFGYDALGHLLTGFPYDTGRGAGAYITIAAVGGPYRRAAVVAAGGLVVCLDHRGRTYPGSYSHSLASQTITSTPAVGDIDGDGTAEVVVAASNVVWAFQIDSGHSQLNHALERNLSGGVSLADFDADGDVEIVAPLTSGVLHVLQEDGAEFAGSWPVTVSSSSLRGVAIADLRSTTTPEVVVAANDGTVDLLNTGGTRPLGWPNDTEGRSIYGGPVVGRVVGTASAVMAGSQDGLGWGWTPTSLRIDGWPRAFSDDVHRTPAYGDLDLDGHAEAVFLTEGQLAVVDVGTAPSASANSWPMAGHDPGRTGCWECVEDVSAVGDEPADTARVSFASPWPNPVAGPTTFEFALPMTAGVELAIYDLRGCRVGLLERSEQPAGRHQFVWNGCDRDGHPLASGHYLASLRVRGPGLDERLIRKFTVVR